MGIWQKLKRKVKQWISGGKSSRSSGGSSSKGSSQSSNASRGSSQQSTSRRANSTFLGVNRRELLDSVRGRDSSTKQETKNPYEAKSFERFKTTTQKKADASKGTKSTASTLKPRSYQYKSTAERLKKLTSNTEKDLAEYNKATQNRYNVRGAKSTAEALKRRQAQKSQAYDVAVEKYVTKKHPIATSAAIGALSGVTFGASELLAQKSKARQKSGAEEYYQKNKNKTAETVGEIAGSLASFGLTAGAAEKAAVKVGGKLMPKAAERLAERKIIQNAAKRSVSKAVKKGLVKESSEELIKQIGKDKAKKVVSALGTDIVQNLTTGALYDINRASTEHEVGSSDWWKEIGKSAALNAGITGGIAGVSAARGGKRMAVEAANELAAKATLRGKLRTRAGSVNKAPRIGETIEERIARLDAERLGRNTDDAVERAGNDVRVSLNRRRKTDVVLPNERPSVSAVTESAQPANNVTLGNGKRSYTWRVYDPTSGKSETITVRANKASEAADIASEYGSSRGMSWSRNVPNRAKAETSVIADERPVVRNAVAEAEPTPILRKPHEHLQGYSSTGSKKKLSDAQKLVNDLVASGDTTSAKAEINRVVDDVVRNTKNVKPVEATIQDIKEELKNTALSVPDKVDAGYKSGSYNEFRKRNMGTLKLTENGTPVDDYWLSLQKKYGTSLFPDEIDNPSDQLQYLAKLAKTKGTEYELADDELDYLRKQLSDSMWENANVGREHAPFDVNEEDWLTEQAATRPISSEELEALERRAIEDGDIERATPPKPRAETKATPPRQENYATVDEAIPTTNPAQTAENDAKARLENRVRDLGENEPAKAERQLKVNKVAEDEAVSGGLPSGVKQVRSAYEYNNGEQPKLEDGILTSWNEAWRASKEYSASHATGDKNRMSKVAVSQLNAMDSEAERELRQRLADSGELNYDAIRTDAMYDKIAKQMRDDPDRWVKDMIEINEGGALDFRSTPEWQARVQYIMGTIDPSADPASEIAYTEALKLAQNISSKGGQTLNLRRNFVHLTPMGKRDAILDDFINILDKSRGFRSKHPKLNSLGRFDQREYIRNILMEDDAIMDGVKKLVKANELDDVSEAFAELMLNVNKKNPKAGFDVIQELRYLNMLGNPKTHIRNVFGSAFFSPMRQLSNGIRSALEKPIERYARNVSGGAVEVTRHGGVSLIAAKEAWVKNPTTEAGKAALEAFKKNKAEILGSAKYETNAYKGRGKTIAGKAIDALSDFNSNLLSGEDDFFRTRAYRENYIKSYNRYVKDGKPITDKVKRRIEQEALQESQIATFNEYNNFAKWLSNITSKANDANASTLARWGGRGVNAVMPFTKVPANLMKQSINYSPLGIAKGVANIKTAAKNGDAELLNRAIDELASGVTGTGIFGLGMLLGKTTDMFTTNTGKNDPAAKFKKDRGMQNYSITFKDPETGQGHSFTLDWLVPASATFFSGIEMANQLKAGDFNLLDVGGDWSTVMTRLAEPVMETSMLSGLHGMLETMRSGSNDDDTKSAIGVLLRETAQSWLNSLVPTVVGQGARTAYKTDMQVSGDTDWEYFWNQTKSKAGLANTNILGEPLGADTDAYGNVKGEKKTAEDYVKSGLKNFLSPANIQKVDFSEIDNQKLAEYERRVKDGESPEDLAYLFPKKQYKKQFKLAGEDVKLSNRDLSAYNQAKTKGGEEGMRYILENIMFNRPTLDENGKKVPSDDAFTKEQKAALMKEFKGKSMREVEEWLYNQPQFKSATDAERKKAINGLWTLSGQGKSNASQRVGEQAVVKAQGGDINEYNFKNELSEKKRNALQPFVDNGVLTYEEAVDFARNAGKTYYYENEEGGTSQTYFNKKQMIEYLVEKGYPYEKAEALFNSFKASNAKPYNGNSSGRGGYRRRGYRRYHRRGRGGGGGSSKPVLIKQSDYKPRKAPSTTIHKTTYKAPSVKVASTASASKATAARKQSYKSLASTLNKSGGSSVKFNTSSVKSKTASASKSKSRKKSALPKANTNVAKITPPKVKFKKYEV